MSFTYDPTTDRGLTRLALGDIDAAAVLFQDAEVDAMLTARGSPLRAAAALADVLAARYGRVVSQSIDGASFQYGERARLYLDLATRLRAQEANGGGAFGPVFVGGTSKGEMDGVEQNPDRSISAFHVGQDDEPGT